MNAISEIQKPALVALTPEACEMLQQIRVDQAVRALDALSQVLRQNREGLTPTQEHDLWREFIRIGVVKDAA